MSIAINYNTRVELSLNGSAQAYLPSSQALSWWSLPFSGLIKNKVLSDQKYSTILHCIN